ncbi:uncharacterized protein LOC108913207 [Anoplophora glabripennis]|uniref:uncharacterized protein LOC108913207 n=1 Tax=Anoplophora glabripennis TaxID=217634 RepID=UPI0008748455|nr:uncharacterized protein LOC108913207 [Anoplophora glabripennis]
MDKKAGHVCAARNCRNKQYNSSKSFFTFPKDPVRARTWVFNSHHEDLMENLNNLHKTHRLCGDHFNIKMFTNKYCNRLKHNAIPTIFPEQEGSSRNFSGAPTDHDCYSLPQLICLEEVPAKKVKVLQNVIIPGCEDSGDNFSPQSQQTGQDLSIVIPAHEKENTLQQSPTACTQTSSTLSFGTPRKRKYREQIKILAAENKILMKRNEELEEMLKNAHNNV